ncbi:Tandem pore domain k+ channel [Mycena kentingensis (nom. inval.)]|nr:Tandem pore domain k+ channel [Mycena kentingensis (nom. inval.)]
MLKLIALAFALPRRRPSDAEAGPSEKGDPPLPPTNDLDTATFEEDDEDDSDLDAEHETDDIIRDMELEEAAVEAISEASPNPRPRRERTYSSSLSLITHDKGSPGWYIKLKEVLNPKTTQKDIESYVPNYRYTPILSGIVIPFSILLEIPGLTEHWYIRTENNTIVEKANNPTILNVGLGFSMACALAANACLIARFLEKRVKLMTILCIVFLTIHDTINIIAVTIFGIEHRFNDGFTYGQSFWMTVCSTAVSTFTNLTLIFDLVRTPDFENSGSGLTRRQRSLAILVIILLTYIAVGSLIHSLLLDLNFIDAMYFSVASIETVGFGDIKPVSTGARFFTIIYAIFGIVTIALAVGMMRETVLEGLEVGYRKRVQQVRQRRKIGRWKRRVMNRWREAVEWRLREGGQPVWVKNHRERGERRSAVTVVGDLLDGLWPWATAEGSGSGFLHSNHPHGMHLNLEALSWKQLEAAAMEAGVPLSTLLPDGFVNERERKDDSDSSYEHPREGTLRDPDGAGVDPTRDTELPLTHARLGRMIAMIGSFALAVDKSGHLRGEAPEALPRQDQPTTSPQFKKSLMLQYETFRSGMDKEEARAFYARLVVVWMLFLVFWIVGGLIFMKTEGWSLGVSLYFCVIAFTTIGYGDYSPSTPAGRSIFVAWALLGIATMTILISVIAEAFSSRYHSALHTGVFDRAVKRGANRPQARGCPIHHPRTTSPQRTPCGTPHSRTQTQLEALPHKILADAKTFHEHLSYFVGSGNKPGVDSGEDLPPGLQQLMDEITGAEKIGERIKSEILQDEDARHTLFTLSIEQALRKMINSAEAAIVALEEREQLILHHEQEQNASSSGSSVPQNDTITDQPLSASPVVAFSESAGLPLAHRVREVRAGAGYAFDRWDTSTSSDYSDWR